MAIEKPFLQNLKDIVHFYEWTWLFVQMQLIQAPQDRLKQVAQLFY